MQVFFLPLYLHLYVHHLYLYRGRNGSWKEAQHSSRHYVGRVIIAFQQRFPAFQNAPEEI